VVNDKGELVGVNHAAQVGSDLVAIPLAVSEVRAFLETAAPETDSAARSRKLREEGISLLRKGNYRGAIDQLNRAIKLNGNDHVAFNERGAAYTWLDQDGEAIKDFSQAIALSPKYAMAYRNRGAAHLRQGQPQKAVDDLTQAIALNPDYLRAYKDRGDAYTRLGKTKEAQADYAKAADLKRRAEAGR
jgi:Flp pilus assembly protein TadD